MTPFCHWDHVILPLAKLGISLASAGWLYKCLWLAQQIISNQHQSPSVPFSALPFKNLIYLFVASEVALSLLCFLQCGF